MPDVMESSLSGAKVVLLNLGRVLKPPALGCTSRDSDLTKSVVWGVGIFKIVKVN